MKRAYVLELLNLYEPATADEIAYKKHMLDFVISNPDCFERTRATGHLTASAWLLSKDRQKALLMHHSKLNIWVQPGGHCDGESNVLAVAIKEAQEESGIIEIAPLMHTIFDIDIHLIPEYKKIPAHYHYDIRFLLGATSDQSCIKNHESKELRWIGKDRQELPTNETSIIRMFEKWVAYTPAVSKPNAWHTKTE